MRWSLVLSAFVIVQAALSFVCVALPIISTSFEEFERREPGRVPSLAAKASSREYRNNARDHPYQYNVSPTKGVGRVRSGTKQALTRKLDADHVFEHQVYNKVLKNNNLDHKTLPKSLQQKTRKILNRPRNMALIRADLNRGKGSVVKQGLLGKPISAKEDRNKYIHLSYPQAKRTAVKLDKAFQRENVHLAPGKGFTSTLRNTMNSAGILHPNQPSPQGSLGSSPNKSSSSGSPGSKKTGSPDSNKTGSPSSKSGSSGSMPGSPTPAKGSTKPLGKA